LGKGGKMLMYNSVQPPILEKTAKMRAGFSALTEKCQICILAQAETLAVYQKKAYMPKFGTKTQNQVP
jgi:hypothetical protein